jgi:hypothetical protein
METLYYLSAFCLIVFMILAMYDGIYLHIWKFELFKRKESKFEHKTHTIRAILFPLILWLLFINHDKTSFFIGISFFITDLVVLAFDAFSEKDSRKSLGGLPRWEYILHLFANSFHFASIMLMISTKTELTEFGLAINENISHGFGQKLITIISINIIPGAILMAFLHLFLILPSGISLWAKIKNRALPIR